MAPVDSIGENGGVSPINHIRDASHAIMSFVKRSISAEHSPSDTLAGLTDDSPTSTPLESDKTLVARMAAPTKTATPGKGSIAPKDINMEGLLALFAILGAVFVLGAIWFFFWAKNGGFVWRKGDWEEYKSTVLRRKDSEGRTLSNATKSTKLGGGSIVGRGFSDYTDGMTENTAERVPVEDSTVTSEKPKRKGFREAAKEKLLRRRKDDDWETGRHPQDEDVRAYRHEKPARVGGINSEPEGTYSTEYTGTVSQPSEWNQSEVDGSQAYYDEPLPPREQPVQRQTQRNASGFSFVGGEDTVSSVTQEEEQHRIREASRRHRRERDREREYERERAGSRKPRGPRPSHRSSRQSSPRKRDRSSMPGGYTAPLDMSSANSASEYQYEHVDAAGSSDVDTGSGTRSYHHPIPGLSKGYRRGTSGARAKAGRRRRDSLSESEGEDYDSRLT